MYISKSIIIVFILFLIFLLYLLRKHYNNKRLKELSAWILTKNPYNRTYNLSLTGYIMKKFQIELCIPEKYRVTPNEKETAELIVSAFREYFSELCLNNSVTSPEAVSKISEEKFFIYHFDCYLEKHSCDHRFIDNEMFEKLISQEGTYNLGSFTYSLTDFALVFFKLNYITSTYLNDSKNMKNIADIIDKQQITLYHYS